jgi:hypothetical protein
MGSAASGPDSEPTQQPAEGPPEMRIEAALSHNLWRRYVNQEDR